MDDIKRKYDEAKKVLKVRGLPKTPTTTSYKTIRQMYLKSILDMSDNQWTLEKWAKEMLGKAQASQ